MTGPERVLDWRAGGWALAAGGVLAAIVLGGLIRTGTREGRGRMGDGTDPASYGFALDPSLIPIGQLVASGVARDAIPALDEPEPMTAADVDALNERYRGKYLVPDDRVIGVTIGGESRAYPLRVLNWHEVINDRLGGVPIVVAYHPLCDSAVVLDRRTPNGDELEFGVSGLLYQSHHLLYDRRAGPASSLWSPLLARAVVGVASGTPLRMLACSIATWERWRASRPSTTVPRPAEDRLSRYERNPYGPYLNNGLLRFPVDPLPGPGDRPAMHRVLVAVFEDRDEIVDLDAGEPLGTPGLAMWPETEPPPSILAEPGTPYGIAYTRWFAWYALHADPTHGRR